jgi:hypothetical protein
VENVRRPSASKINIWSRCRAVATLPWNEDDEPGPAAERGTRIHAALERSYLGARTADVAHVVRPSDGDIVAILAHKPDVTPLEGYPFVEVECWYNPSTGDVRRGTPGDDPPAGYWRGRTDLLGIRPDSGNIAVVDHKTGNPRYQTLPGNSLQLAYFAIWLRHSMGYEDDVDVGVYLTQARRTDWATLTPQVLDVRERELLAIEDALVQVEQTGEPEEPNPGPHCRWCPAICSKRQQ